MEGLSDEELAKRLQLEEDEKGSTSQTTGHSKTKTSQDKLNQPPKNQQNLQKQSLRSSHSVSPVNHNPSSLSQSHQQHLPHQTSSGQNVSSHQYHHQAPSAFYPEKKRTPSGSTPSPSGTKRADSVHQRHPHHQSSEEPRQRSSESSRRDGHHPGGKSNKSSVC